MEDFKTIHFKEEDSIGYITLNRPKKLNAFNFQMQNDLIKAFDEADKDDNVKAIIVTGAGRGFCAGADMDGLAATSQGESQGSQIEAEERDYAVNGVKGFEGGFSYFPTVPKPIMLQ